MDSTAGYNNARCLFLDRTGTLDKLRKHTDAMVDSLLALLEEAGTKDVCLDTWSPERLAATACFYHNCVNDGVLALHVPRDCGADTPAAPRDNEPPVELSQPILPFLDPGKVQGRGFEDAHSRNTRYPTCVLVKR